MSGFLILSFTVQSKKRDVLSSDFNFIFSEIMLIGLGYLPFSYFLFLGRRSLDRQINQDHLLSSRVGTIIVK